MTDTTYRLPVIDSVKTAWEKTKGAKGTLWAVFGLFFAALFLSGLLSNIGLPLLFFAIFYAIEFLMIISLIYLGIRRMQDIPIQYTMIKEALTLRKFLCFVGLYLLQMVIFIPAILVAMVGVAIMAYGQQHEPSTAINLVAFSLYVIAGILVFIISIRMWLGVGFIVDKNLNPIEALKSSFRATKGNVCNLFGLSILMLFIMVGCSITLGIGLIWGMPWLILIYGEVYKRLSSQA